jgi:glutathione peroxidase
MHHLLSPKGFQILAFPCNQFGGQEPGTDEEIQNYVKSLQVPFPVYSKVNVNGKEISELFKFLKEKSNLSGNRITWNFGKFLVSRDAEKIDYFEPKVWPLSLSERIQELL